MNEEFANGASFDLNELAQEVKFDGFTDGTSQEVAKEADCQAAGDCQCENEAPCQSEAVKESDISLEEYKTALDAHFQNLSDSSDPILPAIAGVGQLKPSRESCWHGASLTSGSSADSTPSSSKQALPLL